MAAIFRLPVVFVCENNMYAMSFSVKKAFALPDIAERAKGYGIPGVSIDGNNVLEVYETTKVAVERARQGEGPTFIEARTYRWKGHSKSDRQAYRTKEEVREWMNRDPIKFLEKYLREEKVKDEELENIKKQVEREIEEAIEFALKSPEPTLEEARRLVYA